MSEGKNVPKIRFPGFDGEWEELPMSEVFEERIEKGHSEMPVLSVMQGKGTVLRDSSDRNIQYDKANLKNYKLIRKGDYIIHLRSFEGGLECSNYDGISSPAYRILKPEKIIPAAYKGYFRSTEFIKNKLSVAVVGIRDGKNIDMPSFWDITVPIAAKDEQTKVADFLTEIDDHICIQEKELAKWKELKKGMLQKMFPKEGESAPEIRFPGFICDWEEKKVSELVEAYNDKVMSDCDLPVLTSAKTDGIQYQSDHFGREQNHDVDGYNVLPRGFCTYRNRSDGTDYTFNINNLCDMGIISKFYPVFNTKGSNDLRFLVLLLNNEPKTIQTIAYTAKGTGQKVLSFSDLLKISIMVPETEEQQKIGGLFEKIDVQINRIQNELSKWKELKKGLLQQMFV